MRIEHPDTELIPYLRGELSDRDREKVSSHLGGCADCRRALDAFRAVLEDLSRSAPEPPEVHWGRFRAELRSRIGAHREAKAGGIVGSWRRPRGQLLPLALSATLAGLALVFVVRVARRADPAATEEAVIASNLDLLQDYALVERLDLLEDLDAEELDLIEQLDRLTPSKEG